MNEEDGKIVFFNISALPQEIKYWTFALAVTKKIANFAANFNILCFLVPFLREKAQENALRTCYS